MLIRHKPEDSINEVARMPNTAKLVIIDSLWGHMGEQVPRRLVLSLFTLQNSRWRK